MNLEIDSLLYGYWQKDQYSKGTLSPELITNNPIKQNFLKTKLRESLLICDEYWFNVAFLTNSGLAQLRGVLVELDQAQIKGHIIISSYQYFTEPLALKNLLKLKNTSIRLARNNNSHSKSFIFKIRDQYEIIVGSSNLTQSALTTNSEWNLMVSSSPYGKIKKQVFEEFKFSWEQSDEINPEILLRYENEYLDQRTIRPLFKENQLKYSKPVAPNSMQKKALKKLSELRKKGETRALLISATGTGKTYLSAFDVKQSQVKKLLFVVHRFSIAQKAMQTFQSLLGNQYKMGMYSGGKLDLSADFIFSTIQTISRQEHIENFKRDHFEYIVIDETHRSGASSYQKIIHYFDPQFLLGMTATPERTDGYDIFKLFHNNVASEIRLHQALKENLLCDFHYFGVSELSIDSSIVKDTSDLKKLDYTIQAQKILEKAIYYGADNEIIRGLVFCSSVDHCHGLAASFTQHGYNVRVIDGNTPQEERDHYFDLIESDGSGKLDYIFSYDVLNEGIDIPKINQILLVRPTQSAIVFVQQLGRGLRKASNKKFLTVIDFIGNHRENNFLIPVALFGDRSFNKDRLRRSMVQIERYTPLSCSINFDRIAKEQIFNSIDNAKLDSKKLLNADYNYLKRKIGYAPMMMDFLKHDERDPYTYVTNSKSFPSYLKQADPERIKNITDDQFDVLNYLSTEVNNGKRITESVIIQELFLNESINFSTVKEIHDQFNIPCSTEDISHAVVNLSFLFNNRNYKIDSPLVNCDKEEITFTSNTKSWISQNKQFREFLVDNIDFGIEYFKNKTQGKKISHGFYLHAKYSRKDFCRISNIDSNQESVIYGYKTFEKSIPIFVTLKKSLDISKATQYEDYFISPNELHWMSKHSRNRKSKDIKSFMENDYSTRPVLLFIQKSKEENDFYFMGSLTPWEGPDNFRETSIDHKGVVEVNWKLSHACPNELYEYFNANLSDPES